MRRFVRSLGVAVAVACSPLSLVAQTPAVTFSDWGEVSDDRPWTLGFAFSLTAATNVTHLGVWSGGTLGDYLAGIWDIDGNLISSTTVLATDNESFGFRWGGIAPVVLGPGDYVVGAEFRGGVVPEFVSGIATIPNYDWIEDRQRFGEGLNFPPSTLDIYGDNAILWANFAVDGVSVVPEPSTFALAFAGFAMLGAGAWRRRTRVR